jgi:serine/threonine protein kinase
MKGVLLVHDRDTNRDVAMAIMSDFRDRDVRDLNRFVREARITATLEHPNIVPVYDIGIDASGSPYFTMQYLRGATLAVILKRLRDGDPETVAAFPLARLMRLYLRICNAVAFAHSKGICHFDLKPGNIHCGDFGEVQVIDWGLSGDIAAGEKGQIKGTPGYMAPELIAGEGEPGKSADVYALGGILYALLTFDSPFAGLPQQEVLRRTLTGKLIPPSLISHQIPPGLEAICLKAMALDPKERYQDASDIRRDINASLAGYASSAEDASAMRSFVLFLRRNVYLVIIIALLLLSGVLAYFSWTLYNQG